jgi:hypothetical protein
LNQFSGSREDANPHGHDLGLTDDQWHDLRLDYYFGNTEPPEGTLRRRRSATWTPATARTQTGGRAHRSGTKPASATSTGRSRAVRSRPA